MRCCSWKVRTASGALSWFFPARIYLLPAPLWAEASRIASHKLIALVRSNWSNLKYSLMWTLYCLLKCVQTSTQLNFLPILSAIRSTISDSCGTARAQSPPYLEHSSTSPTRKCLSWSFNFHQDLDLSTWPKSKILKDLILLKSRRFMVYWSSSPSLSSLTDSIEPGFALDPYRCKDPLHALWEAHIFAM